MNFDLSEDEEMLKALTERFVTDHYDHDSRRAFLAEPNGFSSANWELLGELGLIAAPSPKKWADWVSMRPELPPFSRHWVGGWWSNRSRNQWSWLPPLRGHGPGIASGRLAG
ncbi:hypothetical protein ACFSLT_00385 [Novosphingobium resinovorum]